MSLELAAKEAAMDEIDLQFRAKEDARTLAMAEEIKNDGARHDLAKKAAAEMAAEQFSRANAMKKVAK